MSYEQAKTRAIVAHFESVMPANVANAIARANGNLWTHGGDVTRDAATVRAWLNRARPAYWIDFAGELVTNKRGQPFYERIDASDYKRQLCGELSSYI